MLLFFHCILFSEFRSFLHSTGPFSLHFAFIISFTWNRLPKAFSMIERCSAYNLYKANIVLLCMSTIILTDYINKESLYKGTSVRRSIEYHYSSVIPFRHTYKSFADAWKSFSHHGTWINMKINGSHSQHKSNWGIDLESNTYEYMALILVMILALIWEQIKSTTWMHENNGF